MATPFTGVIILLMAALAFTACPTEGSSGSGNAVSIKDIQGVTVPQVGDSPVASITPNSQFSGTVRWEPAHPAFQPRTTYKAIITLNPISPNTMQGVPANYFNVQGAVTVRNNANSGLVEAVFGLTGGEENNPSAITNVAIQGINRPKTGVIATKFVDDVQYSGTVNWSPGAGETFDFGVEYTATVVLTAKRGWTFAVDQGGWSIAGKEATFNNIGQGFAEVKTTFPMTTNDATPISKYGIQLSELPRTGGLAKDIKVRDCDEYTATIEWRGGVGPTGTYSGEVWDGRFLPGSSINDDDELRGPVAYISVFPNKDFTLEGVPEDAFYILGVEVPKDFDSAGKQTNPKNTANRGIVSYTFHKLDRVVTEKTIERFKVPQYHLAGSSYNETPITVTPPIGEIASLVVNNNWQYQGPVEWDPLPNTVSRRFESGVSYTANITLTPRKGWTFYSCGDDFFELPGAISIKHEMPYTGKVTATFPTTAGNDITIDGVDIWLTGYTKGASPGSVAIRVNYHPGESALLPSPGVAIPVDQYEADTGISAIKFEPNENFVAGKAYTVTLAVKARPGFTLEGMAANSFKVQGVQAQHAAGSGILTARLNPVPKDPISGVAQDSRAIGGVPVPTKEIGPAANSKIAVSTLYKAGSIEWDPPLTSEKYPNKWEPNTQYTLNFTLEESAQYELDTQAVDFFVSSTPTGVSNVESDASANIAYAASETPGNLVSSEAGKPANPRYDWTTKTVSIKFHKTAPLVLAANELLPLDPPMTGDTPQSIIEHKDGAYAGTVIWFDENEDQFTTKFEPNKQYRAVVDLVDVPNGYYLLTSGDTFKAKNVAGSADLTPTGTAAQWSTVEKRWRLTLNYAATKDNIPHDIKLDTAPRTGFVPSLGVAFDPIVPGTGLRFGYVKWIEPSKPTSVLAGRFGSNMAYQAKFTLYLDKNNYTLRGIDPEGWFNILDENGDKIKGAEVEYNITDPEAQELELTVKFPPTKIAIATLPSAELNIAKTIPGDFHPENSAAVIRGDEKIVSQYYTGDITWDKNTVGTAFTDDNFEDATAATIAYIATIKLHPTENYTFARVQATDTDVGNTSVPNTAFFKLATGKKVGAVTELKFGNYYEIANTGAETRTGQTQTVFADPAKDEVVITVKYSQIKRTIDAATNKITHANLTSPFTGAPTALSALNAALNNQYEITKAIVWSQGALLNGNFQPNWTFTGTYTVREISPWTFTGLANLEDLFTGASIVIEQSTSTSTAGITTKVLMVGYTTKTPAATGITAVSIAGLSNIPKNGVTATTPANTATGTGGNGNLVLDGASDWFNGANDLSNAASWPGGSAAFKAGETYKLKLVYTSDDPTDVFSTTLNGLNASNIASKITGIPTPIKSAITSLDNSGNPNDTLVIEVEFVASITQVVWTAGITSALTAATDTPAFASSIAATAFNTTGPISLTVSDIAMEDNSSNSITSSTSDFATINDAPYTLTFVLTAPGDNSFDQSAAITSTGAHASLTPDSITINVSDPKKLDVTITFTP